MTDKTKPFAFSQFVPGFDFLRSLSGASAGGGAVPGLPGLSNWVAPTLSVEELDKRINELKTVQYWLEQNGHALKATIQALEVQKMTLSTLQGMNVRMEDLAKAFTQGTASAAAAMRDAATSVVGKAADAPAPAPAPAAAQPDETEPSADEAEDEAAQQDEVEPGHESSASKAGRSKKGAQGVVDTLQWWNALSQQFQQIASNALQDAAELRMPVMPVMPDPAQAKPNSAKNARAANASSSPQKKAKPAASPRSRSATGAGKATSAAKSARKTPAESPRKPAARTR